jgi:hypothetical protein
MKSRKSTQSITTSLNSDQPNILIYENSRKYSTPTYLLYNRTRCGSNSIHKFLQHPFPITLRTNRVGTLILRNHRRTALIRCFQTLMLQVSPEDWSKNRRYEAYRRRSARVSSINSKENGILKDKDENGKLHTEANPVVRPRTCFLGSTNHAYNDIDFNGYHLCSQPRRPSSS